MGAQILFLPTLNGCSFNSHENKVSNIITTNLKTLAIEKENGKLYQTIDCY